MTGISDPQPWMQIGDVVHVLFCSPFQREEWRPAQVVSVEDHKIGVQLFRSGQGMALHRDDRGRQWK
jgi:hypothetical protein